MAVCGSSSSPCWALNLPACAFPRNGFAALYRGIFAKKYPPGINEEEADQPLGHYRSLNAVFTRGLKPEFRPSRRASRSSSAHATARCKNRRARSRHAPVAQRDRVHIKLAFTHGRNRLMKTGTTRSSSCPRSIATAFSVPGWLSRRSHPYSRLSAAGSSALSARNIRSTRSTNG